MSIIATIIGIALGGGAFLLWNPHPLSTPAPLPVVDFVENAQAFILPVSQTSYVPTRNFDIPDPIIQARAALVVDVHSGRVLYSHEAEKQLPIASITKLMSAMVVIDQMDINSVYTVSAEDLNVDGNGADMLVGEQFRGTELLRMMLVMSSNDAASVFMTTAQHQGIDFIKAMNEKARALGMTATHFEDPAGLHDQGTYSTAFDVATLLRASADYPFITKALGLSATDVVTLTGKIRHIVSTNQLLGVIPDIVVGKTGNTTGALGTMALYVGVGNGDEGFITVVLGSENRFGHTRELLEWAKKAHTWN